MRIIPAGPADAMAHLNESETCMRLITPAIQQAGWDIERQVRREYAFTKGKIIVRGKLVARGKKHNFNKTAGRRN